MVAAPEAIGPAATGEHLSTRGSETSYQQSLTRLDRYRQLPGGRIMLGQQRQDLTEADGIIVDSNRCHRHARLVDDSYIVVILGPVDATRHRYHRCSSLSWTTAKRDALMDSACRTTSHEPFASPPAAPELAQGSRPATDQGSARRRTTKRSSPSIAVTAARPSRYPGSTPRHFYRRQQRPRSSTRRRSRFPGSTAIGWYGRPRLPLGLVQHPTPALHPRLPQPAAYEATAYTSTPISKVA